MYYILIYFGDIDSRYYLEWVIKWIDLVKKSDVGWKMASSFNGIDTSDTLAFRLKK